MIDHKHNCRIRCQGLFHLGADGRGLNSVKCPGKKAGDLDREAEIGCCAERGNNLAGIAVCGLEGDIFANVVLARMFRDGFDHLRVIDKPLDHVLSAQQLEGLNRSGQTLIQTRHDLFGTPPQKPAHRREEEVRGKCHAGKGQDQNEQPNRKLD